MKEPVQSVRLECTVHNPILTDGPTWDCAAVGLRAIDQNGNLLPYCGEAVQLSVEGPLRILGPSVVPLRGGMAGTYLATTGEAGPSSTAGWRVLWTPKFPSPSAAGRSERPLNAVSLR